MIGTAAAGEERRVASAARRSGRLWAGKTRMTKTAPISSGLSSFPELEVWKFGCPQDGEWLFNVLAGDVESRAALVAAFVDAIPAADAEKTSN